MKRMTKLLASILVVAMAASILCVPAFADSEETNVLAKYAEGTGYVALGDSFTRGFAASDNWKNEVYRMDNHGSLAGKLKVVTDASGSVLFKADAASYECRNVTGSYSYLVAHGLGLNAPAEIRDTDAKYWPIAQNGLTTAFFLDLLGIEDDYCDSSFIYKNLDMCARYQTDLAYFGDPNSFAFGGDGTLYGATGECASIRELINNASLLSIQLGQGDVIYRNVQLYFNTIDLSDTEGLPSAIENLIEQLYSSFEYFKRAYKLLLDYVKENNSDATVVLVGTMNPVQSVVVDNDYLIPIGAAINIVFDLMNKYYQECANEYGYIYVDISNVETPATENVVTLSEMLSDSVGSSQHPSYGGYAQIARMILAALEEKEAAEKEAKTTIRIDLGRFKSVDYVLVNGKSVSNYELNDSVLKVKVGNPFATSLTVATHDGSKVAISVYSLSYNNGYSAYRLYTSNDVLNAATTTAKTATSTIRSALVKLFSK